MNTTDTFSEEELRSTPQESKDRLDSLPKLDSGAFDLASMTPEQKAIYWEEKAKASTRGFHAYKQTTDKELDVLRDKGVVTDPAPKQKTSNYREALIGLGIKDEVSLNALERMGKIAEQNAFERIASDPAFIGSIGGSNLARLDSAFAKLSQVEGYEAVLKYKDEIIKDYFEDPLKIPEDVYSVLETIAGSVLFKHRDEIASDRKPKHDRVNMLGGQGGEKKVAPVRSLEYWERIAKESPQDFAKPEVQKQFNEDMAKLEA